ncbi:MAG: GNAT family N-acetyltransferase [Candidatus Bathyarchaeia archaeon]
MPFHVRHAIGEDHASILEIARSLSPEWFSELGIKDIARDLQIEKGLIAEEDGKAVGFVIYCAKDDRTAELSWIGVRPEIHRKGIGRALVSALEASLAQRGFRTLEVSTVAATIEDESYSRTRSFYRAVGFSDVQIDMKWYPSGADRLLLKKPLSSQAK